MHPFSFYFYFQASFDREVLEVKSHILIVLSFEPVTILLSSNIKHETVSVCPGRTYRFLFDSKSQTTSSLEVNICLFMYYLCPEIQLPLLSHQIEGT